MKRLAIALAALLVVPTAFAELYKYVDKDGKTVYSDQPPTTGNSKTIATPPPSAPATKSYVDRDKEAQKARDEAKKKAGKAEDTSKNAQLAEQRCNEAKNQYQTYVDGGRLFKTNEKGERVFLGDDEIAAERERSKRDMDEACKK
jgi:hypothetical protein